MNAKNSFDYFENKDCPYFPCHEKASAEFFNCLFCYCPLYALGNKCGGNFSYTEDGVKDCSGCLLPHSKGGYDYILKSFPQIVDLTKEKQDQ